MELEAFRKKVFELSQIYPITKVAKDLNVSIGYIKSNADTEYRNGYRIKFKHDRAKYKKENFSNPMLPRKVGEKICLNCDKPFASKSKYNRLCEKCGVYDCV